MRTRHWLGIRALVGSSVAFGKTADARAPQIRSAPGLREPGVVGWLRPVLLLPRGIEERLTPSQFETVLAHELCHVQRRDNFFAALHMLVEALFWFHPLVWWIGAKLVEERERACDEAVLSLGSEPRMYAEAIAGVCRLYVESPLACVAGITGANLKRRIEAIMDRHIGQRLNGGKKLLLAVAGMAAICGPVIVGAIAEMAHSTEIFAQPLQLALPQAQVTTAPAPAPVPADIAKAAPTPQRLVAILVDYSGTAAGTEQSTLRQAAETFVAKNLQPTDRLAVMDVQNDKVRVALNFTVDRNAALKAVGALVPDSANAASSTVAHLAAASRILGGIPDKKALVYVSYGRLADRLGNPKELQEAIDAARAANVALYPVSAQGNAPPERLDAPGSAQSAAYLRYGAPDETDRDGSIWRYNYLTAFHSNVEFEFLPKPGPGVRINYPPGTLYEGTPDGTAGLPGRHSVMHVYPADESSQLEIPLDSIPDAVNVFARIVTRDSTPRRPVGMLEDQVTSHPASYTAGFTLKAGSYACYVVVREQPSQRTYSEIILFDVR